MTFWEDHGGKLIAAAIGGTVTGITWIVRTVFTNHKRLDLLEQKQDMQHLETTRALGDVRSDIHEIKTSYDTAAASLEKTVEMLKEMQGK